jgi:Phage integrase family
MSIPRSPYQDRRPDGDAFWPLSGVLRCVLIRCGGRQTWCGQVRSLRHLYASTALAEGIPITEVSRWLGHKSIEVTHQIYGHLVPSSFDRARNALDHAHQASRRYRRGKPSAEEYRRAAWGD